MIVGTAGHIDHGKTLLVKTLTGVDTDRLKEEKARGITIELGFAYAPLPDGEVLGFVDVPGHERFVHTMLAGAAGIDFVLLVVAADDGVMPQTREHLQVLDLLGLGEGVVALTKCDLVDEERRAAVIADIDMALQGTSLEGADILPVSAVTGDGIEALKARLADEAASRPRKPEHGIFRLAADRAFALAGAGTIVTGTILSGTVAVGDRVLVLPRGIEARVRSLHAQNKAAERAAAGQRCAVNLAGSGISTETVHRGDWLTLPGHDLVSERFDARLKLLPSEEKPIRQWSPVYFHAGTSAITARVVLLENDALQPGGEALVQVVLPSPLPVRHGDRFVIRDVSAQRTMGGGMVLDPRAPARKRRTPERMARLAALSTRDPTDAIVDLIDQPPGLVDVTDFAIDWALTQNEVAEIAEGLELLTLEAGGAKFVTLGEAWDKVRGAARAVLADFHARNPDLPGMPQDKVRTTLRPRLAKPMFGAVVQALASAGDIVAQGSWIRLPEHTSSLGGADASLWDRVRPLIEASPYRPQTAREMAEHLGQPVAKVRSVCKTLARMGELMEIASDRFFLPATVREMASMTQELASAAPDNTFTAAQFKDRAGCGRNVGIQVLEYFDRRGLTMRNGDARKVVKEPDSLFTSRS